MNRFAAWIGLVLALTGLAWARPNYDRIDRYALGTPASAEASVDLLAGYLSRGAHTPEEKARVIYRWITDRIAYDAEAFRSGHPPQDYESALSTRKAVCAGYARLFLVLAEKMGLQAELVHGSSKGYGFDPQAVSSRSQNHAWVAVKLAGRWRLIDPTWGAGALTRDGVFSKKFNDYWFLTPPQQMIYDHFPRDSEWQLLSPPWSMQTFKNAIRVTHLFFDYGLEPISHRYFAVSCDGETTLRFRGPENLLLTANLLSDNGASLSTEESWTLVSHQGRESTVKVRCPSMGSYKLRLYGRISHGPTAERSTYEWLAEYRVECRSRGRTQSFPRSFSAFAERQVQLVQPTQRSLSAGHPVRFSLVVPGAAEVRVNWPGGEQALSRSNDSFQGECQPERGKLTIYALFPQETKQWGLLEYEVR